MEKIEFTGETPFLKTFQSNKDSFRVEINCGRYELENLKKILMLPEGMYKIEISPIIEEQ